MSSIRDLRVHDCVTWFKMLSTQKVEPGLFFRPADATYNHEVPESQLHLDHETGLLASEKTLPHP